MDFFVIGVGIARIGIRLFGFIDEERTSFDVDRGSAVVVVVVVGFVGFVRGAVDVGVCERTDGFDPCVFVLLSDDVEPPVDVD